MRSCSYTRKNVHRKKNQGQEVSCIQNEMGVGGEPYIAYDPQYDENLNRLNKLMWPVDYLSGLWDSLFF